MTASGLGCEHWPGCTAGNPFPEKDYHAFVEFGNRMVATIPLGLTLATAAAAWFVRGLSRWAVWLAVAVAIGTFAQAPLGYVTVKLDLHPLIVMSHLLLSLLVLAGGVVLALEAVGLARGRASARVAGRVRAAGLGLAGAALALVVSGAFVTAAGPHPGGVDVRRFGTFSTALWVHVRATAIFGIALLVVVAYLARQRSRWPLLHRASLVVLALALAQGAVGEIQYRLHLPWWLVLVHVALAAAVWGAAVGLTALFFRPPASFAPQRA